MTRLHHSGEDPPRYFLVDPGPFRMTPGLHRLGHDFGNGAVDAQCFQRDRFAPRFRAEKARILDAHSDRLLLLDDPPAHSLQLAALDWMKARLHEEHGSIPALRDAPSTNDSAPDSLRRQFREVTLQVQEDFALLQRTEESDRLILLSVCFPSGWRPESLLGKDFLATHEPVPEFEELAQKSNKLTTAITERGPYVRFVWSATADDRLDHHPDQASRDPWTDTSTGYLRVERQVTVPFPDHQGCLFLIRTYLTPFPELSRAERSIVRRALDAMPDSIRAYKGLLDDFPRVLGALGRADAERVER